MIRVYVKDSCPYSRAVLEKLEELEVPFEKSDIKDKKNARELLSHGGRPQVPFLEDVDPCEAAKDHAPCIIDKGIAMYESRDIVAYLDRTYGASVRE